MKAMRQLLRYLGVCDGNMEEGSLRCDANVSIRPKGQAKFGTRAEIKNINSFRFVQQAIDYEIERQADLIRGGGQVVQETRLWDSQSKSTRSMRSKEEAHDYRYFPEPDLPDLVLEGGFVEKVKKNLPELPHDKLSRYTQALGLSAYDAKILTEDPDVAAFFDTALAVHKNVKSIANWVINEVLRELKGREVASLKFGGQAIGELVKLIDDNTISGKIAKDVFAELLAHGGSPKGIVDAKGWVQVTDTGAIEPIVDKILAANAESVEKYKAGKTNVIGFLVGLVMKESKGKANPAMVNDLLKKKLGS
jgi:aspartyl-tRNA(Asn)/glutamyl-tRNA(Gln) amidotransferase subunit B